MDEPVNRLRLDSILFALLGSDQMVKTWWDSPNLAFKGYSPTEMLDIDHHAVVRYIYGQMHGDYH